MNFNSGVMMKWYSFLLLGGVLVLLDGCNETINNKSTVKHPMTTVVSLNNRGEYQNGESGSMDLSDNGRYVAFASKSTNLVYGFNDDIEFDVAENNVYLRDNWENITYIVSANREGLHAHDHASERANSGRPSISAGGRYVAFESNAVDLLPGNNLPENTSGNSRIYRWDRVTGETILVSRDWEGGEHHGEKPCINHDGTLVAFLSDVGGVIDPDPPDPIPNFHFLDLYITDLSDPSNPSPHLITWNPGEDEKGDGDSDLAVSKRCFTRDGSFIFSSKADNLQNLVWETQGSDWDVFIAQHENDGSYTIRIVSTSDYGEDNGNEAELIVGSQTEKTWSGGASISSDGQHIVFLSNAKNLDSTFTDVSAYINVFWKNRDHDGNGSFDYDDENEDKTNTRCISRTNFHPYQSVGKLGEVNQESGTTDKHGIPDDLNIAQKYPAITGDGSTILLISSGLDSTDQLPKYDIYTHTVRKQSTAIWSFYRTPQGGTELYTEDCLNGTLSRTGSSIVFNTDISQLNSFFNSNSFAPSMNNNNIVKIGPN